jgi:heat shock protein HslJ
VESKQIIRPARTKGLPMLRSVRSVALASALFCTASLALGGCGSATSPEPVASATSASAGFTGYHWLVVAIGHEGKVTSIPAHFKVDLRFSQNGRFLADDPVNSHSGTFRMTNGGFTTSALASTAAGYIGHDPVILLSQSAMMAFDNGNHASAQVAGNRLVVTVGSYTLTCVRHGPAGNNL